ncbi:gliding motility-associated peptidyl-prolyl isomerase GldI [Maribacter sp. 2308TA10-17]|uniref:gliding motility-associated peptidyl-prolyl isomerase GldI n=1 Tax=Maribacter sp. 2308TA10-17 TaxID=3386276 RepID=UPI0039BD39C1
MKHLICILILAALISCEGPSPRHPVKRNTTSSIQVSIERSKKLLALEEAMIQQVIAKDSLNTYVNSDTGSWYYYNKKNQSANYMAQPDDLVTLTYNILTLTNDTIYSMQDVGILKYKVDKQEFFPGLRNSVKLLKENETATFLFPSSLGYGYPGDGDKIGINMPLKSTIAIVKIEKENDTL